MERITTTVQQLFTLLLAVGLCALSTQAQIATGTWREHLPYGETIDVVKGGSRVFCATPYAVFSYDESDNSIERLSRVNRLSASQVTALGFDNASNTLLVGHANGQLDLVSGAVATPMNDIPSSQILGDKRINSIYVLNGMAYLCTGFGVVVVDIAKREVAETWFITGQTNLTRINDLTQDGQHWFAAAEEGIYRADFNSAFLVSFETWSLLDELPIDDGNYTKVVAANAALYAVRDNGFDDELWVTPTDALNWTIVPGYENQQITDIRHANGRFTISGFNVVRVFSDDFQLIDERLFAADELLFPRAALCDANDRVWVANEFNGLISFTSPPSGQTELQLAPVGPRAVEARRISAFNSNVWMASGGVNAAWTANFDKKGMYGLVNEQWINIAPTDGVNEVPGLNDILTVAVDPLQNNRVIFGSWEEGLIEVVDGTIVQTYNETNSTLEPTPYVNGLTRTGVAGAQFDPDGNLWFTNVYSSQRPLHVLSREGQFFSYTLQPQVNAENFIADLLTTSSGFIWGVLPRGEGLIVFDPAGTLDDTTDDRYRLLTNVPGQGGLPSNDIYSIEEDLNGEVWVGTLQGIAVFYTPLSIFDDGVNTDAQQILIEQDGNIQILLETEQINAIAIDGANRKWIATAGSGVFLVSPNGQEEIAHFTTRNSPILSDNVFDIAINQASGEVFFATENGVISYMSTATNFDNEISEVIVFPNPVRPDYEGVITIDGLAYQSDVRITDTAGNLVYATTSNGGRATWDGNGRDGRRVATGVYLVFAASPDGSAANVGKLAIIGR